MLNKEQIKRNFSQSAPYYDQYAGLQRELADELLSRIRGRSFRKILDVGCGTGYLTLNLAKEFPLAEVIGIDLAPGMIEVAKRKCKLNNLSFMVGDGECLSSFGSTFDLIVTNASLQWMEARKFFNEVRKVLEVDGTLALSTFGPQTLQELKRVGFSINTFPSFLELLTLLGEFEPLFLQTKLIKRKFKSVKEIIYHLKELGASYKKVERGNRFDPFSALKEYREKFGTEVTFEVIFIVTSRRIN